jgi:hypothetical protein
MKRILPALAILLLIAAGIYFLLLSKRQPAPVAETSFLASPHAESANVMPRKSGANLATAVSNAIFAVPTPAPSADLSARAGMVPPAVVSTNAPDLPPQAVAETVRRAIRHYGEMFGGNPVGTNPEITDALNGNNPKHINFINADGGMRINGEGELIDAWGTPFFFHQISGTETEVRSAGPDKVMWTGDDVVVK